jgi:cystathionine gamma-synthase/cystathionine gamma-lyase/cystathionine beta-lyase
MKTMALRVRHQNASALALAGMLERCEAVTQVNYPGLASHPQHERAARLFSGCGGVLSFELCGGRPAAEKLLERLRIPASAPSLGGVETLITRPAATSHAGLSEAERQTLGIGSGLVRVAVGIESAADLIADFEQGLAGL